VCPGPVIHQKGAHSCVRTRFAKGALCRVNPRRKIRGESRTERVGPVYGRPFLVVCPGPEGVWFGLTRVCVCVCVCVCVRVYVCICIFVYTYVCIYIY